MEAELRKAPPSYRMSMLSKVRNYKRDVEQLTADVVCSSWLVILHYIMQHICNLHFMLLCQVPFINARFY